MCLGWEVRLRPFGGYGETTFASGLPTVDHGVGKRERRLAGSTGLEPAASGVTGRRSNQLNYDPEKKRADVRIQWAVQDSNL